MEIKPVRIQRSRQHKMISPNRLPVVYIGRPSRWGNPYEVGKLSKDARYPVNKEQAVAFYINYITINNLLPYIMTELKDRNLMCWCSLQEKNCHARYLLSVANSIPLDQVA